MVPMLTVKLAVVTVNYGSAPYVLDMLAALVPELEALEDATVWIVDNHSPDDSVAVLRAAFAERGYGDRVRLLESPVNGGFGAGNNVGIRAALALDPPPDAFYLLNPDARPTPGTVRAFVEFLAAHPEAGVVGGPLYSSDGSLQCAAFRFPTFLGELEGCARIGVLTRLLPEHRVPMDHTPAARAVDWVSGANLVVRRDVLERVGTFDEGFFLYFEEVDLCRRVREAGFGVWYVPEAGVVHLHGVTTGMGSPHRRLPRYWFESRRRCYRKAYGAAGALAMDAAALGGTALHRLAERVKRRPPDPPHFIGDLLRYR